MIKKDEKAKKYAAMRFGNNESQYQMAKTQACAVGYMAGWDEALKQIIVDARKELPKYGESVCVINGKGEKSFCHRCDDSNVIVDRYGWCNYTGSEIVAWIRNVTFEEILAMNKDVLKRLKDK